jgi:hypothetical protein
MMKFAVALALLFSAPALAANYAVVDSSGNIVNRIVMANASDVSPPAGQTFVAEPESGYSIGGTYLNGVYTPPVISTPTITVTTVQASVLLGRLTDAEYTAIMQAATSQLAAGNGQLSRWLDMARTASVVGLTDEPTVAAKSMMVSAGLLTQARAAIIFVP